MNVDQVGPPRNAATGRRWGWAAGAAVLLGATGPVGIALMNILQDRADDATARAGLRDRASAHWSKGFDFVLPAGLLVALAVAVVLALTLLIARRSPVWIRPVSSIVLFVALFSSFPVGLVALDYHEYPGADVSTLNGSPCGV